MGFHTWSGMRRHRRLTGEQLYERVQNFGTSIRVARSAELPPGHERRDPASDSMFVGRHIGKFHNLELWNFYPGTIADSSENNTSPDCGTSSILFPEIDAFSFMGESSATSFP